MRLLFIIAMTFTAFSATADRRCEDINHRCAQIPALESQLGEVKTRCEQLNRQCNDLADQCGDELREKISICRNQAARLQSRLYRLMENCHLNGGVQCQCPGIEAQLRFTADRVEDTKSEIIEALNSSPATDAQVEEAAENVKGLSRTFFELMNHWDRLYRRYVDSRCDESRPSPRRPGSFGSN